MTVINVHRVEFRHGFQFALKEVSLEIGEGQTACILGPNGSGKTTLFEIMAGVKIPLHGYVEMFGQNYLENFYELSPRVMAMPFFHPVDTLHTPFLFWQGMGAVYGLEYDEICRRLQSLVPQMCLDEAIHKKYDTLSLGMKRKVVLVAAFLPDVQVRMMDEPFSGGIDPLAMEVLASWMMEARQRGETIVFSSQLTEHARRLADRTLILRDGKVAFYGTTQEMMDKAGISKSDARAEAQAYIAIAEDQAENKGPVS